MCWILWACEGGRPVSWGSFWHFVHVMVVGVEEVCRLAQSLTGHAIVFYALCMCISFGSIIMVISLPSDFL